MTPNEQLNTTPFKPVNGGSGLNATKAASTICLLAGIWFFISPWVYRAYTSANAWNSWIVGGFMILFGIIRLSRPAYSTILSWCNTILGIWTFFSPWIYGYTNDQARFINSLCVGVIVFVFSIASAMTSRRTTAPPSIHATSH
jgi:hypothetical protein